MVGAHLSGATTVTASRTEGGLAIAALPTSRLLSEPGNWQLRWRPVPVDRTTLRPFHCVSITPPRCTSGSRVHRKTTAVRTVFAIRRRGICGIFRRVPTMSRSDRSKWTEALAPAAMIGPQASPYRNIHALFERRKVSAFTAIFSLVTPAAIDPVASIGRSNPSVPIAVRD